MLTVLQAVCVAEYIFFCFGVWVIILLNQKTDLGCEVTFTLPPARIKI